MTRVAHALCAAIAAVLLWRALAQVWVDEAATDAVTSVVLRLAIPAFSAAASALAIAAGFTTARPRRFFALDALSWGVLLMCVPFGMRGSESDIDQPHHAVIGYMAPMRPLIF